MSSSSRLTHPYRGADGTVSQDMVVSWREVSATIRDTVKSIEGKGEIKAIGVTGQGDGFWPLDKNFKPVQDALLWIDGRTCSIISRWDEMGIIGNSGRVVFSGSPLAYATWYAENKPEVLEKTQYILFCKDWIKYCLTGEIVTDPTDLSDASLIDVQKRAFSRALLKDFDMEEILEKLPPMKKSTEIIGYITEAASRQTGLNKGIPVVNGMIDIAASVIGAGVIDPSVACTIVGTTLFNEIVIDNSHFRDLKGSNRPSLICHGTENRWLLAFGTMTGTPNIDWFLSKLFDQSCNSSLADKELVQELERIPAGSDGIFYHPYLGEGGERAPFFKPTAAAQFTGLKSRHSKYHLIRAVCEGVAYSMKDCYANFPIDPKMIRIAGGGSKCDFWCQIFANCVGKPIQVTYGDEIGAKGAAITAAASIGYFNSLEEGMASMVRVAKSFDPQPMEKQIYSDGYRLYQKIVRSMWDIWDENKNFIQKYSKNKETT
ncbi:MAG: hypothetical protein PWQ29_1210 [Verrucomicrobiota bacterium]|nr:hypothetical protein [Verrucomicrobiota bacterium]